MPTHKKGHDKDKYYHLAKDQGYRSRAAYKLLQINKRYDFLAKARVCIDLCAAPGGWCQVAAKLMPTGSIVLGIDLLPIRPIRNVKTLVQDITTAECRKQVTAELHGWQADVVLCDGAPNVGSAYQKDAYVQNELVLAALKTATDHLIEGGTFVTKVYRSKDYNALVWVLQQLFVDVQAMKPNSSRSQSAEIFLVCMKYLAPNSIDPKLLDPNHVFKEVADPSQNRTVDVLHKKYDLHNKRHRSGYDDDAGPLLSKKCTVTDFVNSKDPVRLLTDMTELLFTPECRERYESHPATSQDIMISFQDLKVLGRIDFKKLLKWRLLMIKANKPVVEEAVMEEDVEDSKPSRRRGDEPLTEEEIQEEIAKKRENMEKLKRKQKKRTRELAAKERQRQALGINSSSFGVEEDVELFSLADTAKRSELSGIDEVDLSDLEDGFDDVKDSDDEGEDNFGLIELDDDELEQELEAEYLRFASRSRARKDRELNSKEHLEDDIREGVYDAALTTKKAKAARTSEALIAKRGQEDEEDVDVPDINGEIDGYVKMLTGSAKESDDDSSSDSNSEESGEEDSSEDEEDVEDEEDDEDAPPSKKQNKGSDSLVNTRDELSLKSKANKWFSNPIFQESVVTSSGTEPVATKKTNNRKRSASEVSNEDDEAAALRDLKELSMPLTDKQKRKEQRKKDTERRLRREEKRKRKAFGDDAEGMFSAGIEIAPQETALVDEELDDETANMREMIRQGMGKAAKGANDTSNLQYEIAPAEPVDAEADSDIDDDYEIDPNTVEMTGARMDPRTYDSDEEVYDNKDRAMTLALGTLMLRKSRKKALVDASYNRYAWNDPTELPSWFVDDEMRHNRPQLPVPNALLEQVKGKFQKAGTKEIKKVAEARMRKRKRAAAKLKSAKAQAKTFAENSDMTDKQKIKAISKAMKGTKSAKPSKVYVVTRKQKAGSMGTSSGGKGKYKFVDKRMKSDTRGLKAKEKRAKKGRKK